ncbi:hypothetical protein U1Q18_018438 [Sarracenia purpurea var. burkii]
MEGENSSVCEIEEEKVENGTTATRTRVFVGGLGGTVTAGDLRNTFSSLGKVDSVEIIRTQGRSFAYFDFLPSSHKSLSKLFSTYNGCMWKGGRLRLEKAKEHYLLRLRREQAEDAKFADCSPTNLATKTTGPEKLNNVLNPEKMEVQLFFPKLRKVRSLPFSGTGKHKYSFQRIEVPPLPIHFCDCEEHSDPSHTAKEEVTDEKELNMMKSVMNKLFDREFTLEVARNRAGSAKEGDSATKSFDSVLVDESEADHTTDEDSLVTNMVAGGKSRTTLLESWGHKTILPNEVEIADELQTSKDKPSKNLLQSQRGKKIVPSDRKRKSPLTEETDGDDNTGRKGSARKTYLHKSSSSSSQAEELESRIQQTNTKLSWSQKSAWRDLAGERGNDSFSISHIIQSAAPNKQESESDGVNNVPSFTEHQNQKLVNNMNLESQSSDCLKEPKKLAVTDQPRSLARGASWLQKSSWAQLVGETNNSSFSISQLLPGKAFGKQEQAEEPNSTDATNSAVQDFSSENDETILGAPEQSQPQKSLRTIGEMDKITAPKKNHAATVQPSVRNFTIGETCSFMRSAASMRDWKNSKAALSVSLKKKHTESQRT